MLELNPMDRNGYQQRHSGRGDRREGDHGGHLIASIFSGSGDAINLVPMNGALNSKDWRAMERSVESDLNDGKSVSMRIQIGYDGTSKRPNSLGIIVFSDDDERQYVFRNK